MGIPPLHILVNSSSLSRRKTPHGRSNDDDGQTQTRRLSNTHAQHSVVPQLVIARVLSLRASIGCVGPLRHRVDKASRQPPRTNAATPMFFSQDPANKLAKSLHTLSEVQADANFLSIALGAFGNSDPAHTHTHAYACCNVYLPPAHRAHHPLSPAARHARDSLGALLENQSLAGCFCRFASAASRRRSLSESESR